MHDEPKDIPPPPQPDEVSSKAVAALIFGVLGLSHLCPCIGAAVAVGLGFGEKSGVGRAALVLGVVTLVLDILFVAAVVLRILVEGWL
jgi:hypothetical protein